MDKLSGKASQRRIDGLHRLGCIVTLTYHDNFAPGDIHHITDCGRRMGDRFTICLTPWYHRGVCTWPHSPKEMEKIYGPSLALSKRKFTAAFGTELELLESTNSLLHMLEVA